jgi:hypothetical protein
MKVYIPFNSNDFNSVFTTLSISPCSFYPNRKFSFKRATATFLNENEDFLVGHEKPIFHNKEFDKDYGFPVLIEIDVDKQESEVKTTNSGLRYVIIDSTIFLLNNFKLIFRREKELNEAFAKSLKSIETKYVNLAKQNSLIVNAKEDCFINELPLIKYPTVNPNFNSIIFQRERKLNRLLGIVLGSSIAYSNLTSKEWQEISILLRGLNNNLSLYLNKVSDNNEFEKKQSLEIIDKILKVHEKIENLDEAIMLESTITSDFLNTLKQSKIFNISAFNLLIEGLLVLPKNDLPLSLKLEKLKRAINAKFNSKYPNNYIDRVNNAFSDVRIKIDSEINLSKKNNKLTVDDIVKPSFINNKLNFKILGNLTDLESKYLVESLCFFVDNDNVTDLETFFTNRKSILIDLAKHFKVTIANFDNSKERKYLIELLNSFDSLRGGFHTSGTNNEVLKSLAILFTSGRDLLRFIENNEREEIQNSLIYYALWGSIYGAATLPKTLTEAVTDDNSNIKSLIIAFNNVITDFGKTQTDEIIKEPVPTKEVDLTINEKSEEESEQYDRESSKVNEPNVPYQTPISVLGSQVVEQVETKKKVKLSDLKTLSKTFKNNGDVENLINNQLKDKIKVTKKGQTKFAELIDNNELKFA